MSVVVTDLDGTVGFDADGPGPEVAAALAEIAAHPDLRLVFASSRPPAAIRRYVGPLADGADLVACNGALLIRDGYETCRTPLPDGLVGDVLTVLADQPFGLDYGHWFSASTPGALRWMGTVGRAPIDRRTGLRGVLKVATADDRLHQPLASIVGDRAEIVRHTDTRRLEIVACGVNKATGLALLLGSSSAPVIAFGNDTNDTEMLCAADTGVIVGDGLRGLDGYPQLTRVPADDAAVAAAFRDVVSKETDDRILAG
jgi:hydroxymethylpyrimidine pyrophosphatase-like HAD family hydrolase